MPCATGNHGRIFDCRPRAKSSSERNADWLIYQLVIDHFLDDPRLTIQAPEAGEVLFSIYGLKLLLTHGDQLGAKGGDGLIGAIGPVMRGNQKTARAFSSLGIEVDHMIIGHWHQSFALPTMTVCGSLKGPDEYTTKLLRAPAEDPSQMLMMVHPKHGIWTRMIILLRDDYCPSKGEARDPRCISVFDADAA